MNPFLGVLLHAIGGLAAGSFYVPFRAVRRWAWESYWFVQGVAAWVIAPTVASILTVPAWRQLLADTDSSTLFWTYLFGLLWGVGGLTFGLSMRYLGMSLGYAIALGSCAACGTLIPPIYDGTFGSLFETQGGYVVFLGVLVCLAGIGVCGYAGIRREKESTDEQKKQTIAEYSLVKGFLVALFCGVMSACMAFAIAAGKPLADAAAASGADPIYQNNPVFIVIMAGGFTTNCIWCLALNLTNRTFGDYFSGTLSSQARNYLFSSLAGVIWYCQFFYYGMGTTQMGRFDFASWTIHMAFIIVFSNMWGIGFGEWRGSSNRTFYTVLAGLAILIASTILIGLGNLMEGS